MMDFSSSSNNPKYYFKEKCQHFSFLGVNVRAKDDSTDFGQEQSSVNKQKKTKLRSAPVAPY